MRAESVKMPCEQCGGRGGWYLPSAPKVEANYIHCPFCDSMGFVEQDIQEEAQRLQGLLLSNSYKKAIEDLFGTFCNVRSYSHDLEEGKITIEVHPYSESEWTSFLKILLKLAHFHSGLELKTYQQYYYSNDNRYLRSWFLEISPDTMRDLDGVVTALKDWNERRKNKEDYNNFFKGLKE